MNVSLLRVCLVCMLFGLNACTMDYTRQIVGQSLQDLGLKETHLVSRSADWRFDAKVHLAVAPFVDDSVFAYQLQSRSSIMLQNQLLAQIGYSFPHTQSVFSDDLPTMLHHARSYAANVLIVPSVISYQERLNDWNERKEGQTIHAGRPYGADQMALQLRVYDVVGGALLDVVKIQSRSARIDFTSGQVSDLFKPGIAHYLQLVSAP